MMIYRCVVILVLILSFSNLNARDEDKNTGLFGSIELSYINHFDAHYYYQSTLYNFDIDDSHVRSINVLGGYYVIPKRLALGFGVGIDGFQNPYISTFPLYGDLRYFLSKKRNAPYLQLDYGGFLRLGSTFYNTGRYFKAGIGYKRFVSQKLCMTFAISYAPSKINENSQNYYLFKGIAFSIGFVLF